MTLAVRPPAVAGSFYPADPDALARTVDALLAAASPDPHTARPDGLIVPHAGYQYSGAVAATGYARLRPWHASYRSVVLLGPSHFVAVASPTLPEADVLRTPLGDVPVEATEHAARQDRPHAREHSLEVQLPFLQRVLDPGWTALPILLGAGVGANVVADCLDALWADDVLVVVSSDLSHYHDYATARRLDRRTARAVVARNGAAVGERDACGAMAIRGALAWASRHGVSVSLLDLRTSADTGGDSDRVVGYGAFAFDRR